MFLGNSNLMARKNLGISIDFRKLDYKKIVRTHKPTDFNFLEVEKKLTTRQ